MNDHDLYPHAEFLFAMRANDRLNQKVRETSYDVLQVRYGIPYNMNESWMDRARQILDSGIPVSDEARALLENSAGNRGGVHLDHVPEVLEIVDAIQAAQSVADVIAIVSVIDFQFLSVAEHREKSRQPRTLRKAL